MNEKTLETIICGFVIIDLIMLMAIALSGQ